LTATLSDLPADRLRSRLRRDGLNLGIGPFRVRLRSTIPVFGEWLPLLYGHYPVAAPEAFADFQIRIDRPWGLRRWWRPQSRFRFDNQTPFKPLPLSQAMPFFEWGLNWCVAQHAQRYLVLHAAVVARGGRALLLPGEPGAGKSTLCAGLVARGWRLLSDELALIRPDRGDLLPLPRPISLKNGSIPVIRRFAPRSEFGPFCRDTAKGVITHLRAPRISVEQAGQPARPAWVVFPRFQAGAELALTPCPAEEAFQALIEAAFNYPVQGPAGFHALADLGSEVTARHLRYSDLDAACQRLERLAEETA
jgi:hypothetical protein